MSIASASTTPDRHSLQQYKHENIPEVPTKIVGNDDETMENTDQEIPNDVVPVSKFAQPIQRPVHGRLSGLGSA
jgi:hypothetical protein